MGDYTLKDIVVLMNILTINHRLSCTLHMVNKPYIYIKNKSMPLLLNGIRPYISSFPHVRNVHKDIPLTVVPVKSYPNADLYKHLIIKENTGKSGGGGLSLS